MKSNKTIWWLLSLLVIASMLLTACGGGSDPNACDPTKETCSPMGGHSPATKTAPKNNSSSSESTTSSLDTQPVHTGDTINIPPRDQTDPNTVYPAQTGDTITVPPQ
jgi:hypothetical protein